MTLEERERTLAEIGIDIMPGMPWSIEVDDREVRAELLWKLTELYGNIKLAARLGDIECVERNLDAVRSVSKFYHIGSLQ